MSSEAQTPIRLFFDARYIRTDFHDGISRFSAELARAVAELVSAAATADTGGAAGAGAGVAAGAVGVDAAAVGTEASEDAAGAGGAAGAGAAAAGRSGIGAAADAGSAAPAQPERPVRVIYLIHDDAQVGLLPEGAQTKKIHAPTSPLEPLTAMILNRYRPDALFSPMQTIGSLGRRYKLILTLHDTIYYRHRTPPRNLPQLVRLGWRLFHLTYIPQRFVLNGADVVATVSETSRRQFDAVRLTKRPVTVLGNAPQQLEALLPGDPASQPATGEAAAPGDQAATAAAGGDPERGATLQAEAGGTATALARRSAEPPRNIVYMGSFMPYKNVETLVRGMRYLPDHTLHLLSRVSDDRRAELRSLAGPEAKIVFHNGVSDAEYARLLDDRAILATLSLDEGYGLPIAEALAFGVPAVVSDLEIFREVAGEGALFVPAQDPAAFAEAVRSLDDAAIRDRVVAAGLAHAATYTWRRTAETLLGAVRELVGGR